MFKVSVIVPVYKTEKYLKKCIDSILTQTYCEFELILVDDGSPDRSGQLCDDFARENPKIKVIHKKNGGLTSARKAGLAASIGKYIVFVDSDDYVHPRYLELLVKAIEQNDAQLAICSYYSVNSNNLQAVSLPLKNGLLASEQIKEGYIIPLIGKIYNGHYINLPGFMCLRMYERSCIQDKYFFSEREVFTEDDLFNIYYAEKISRIAVINVPLYYYVQRSESLTHIYRVNCWEMLRRRYEYCRDWLIQNGELSSNRHRLLAALFHAISVSIDNACSLNNFRDFKKELCIIYKDQITKSAFCMELFRLLTIGQRVTFLLFYFKIWHLLWIYRRKRLNG